MNKKGLVYVVAMNERSIRACPELAGVPRGRIRRLYREQDAFGLRDVDIVILDYYPDVAQHDYVKMIERLEDLEGHGMIRFIRPDDIKIKAMPILPTPERLEQ